MKIIVVMPVKNEDWILETTLQCLELFADHIIIADQQSTDQTPCIYKKFLKVTTIENKARFHTSNVRKLLLDAARGFDGNNAIFSFDADEIPTSHILRPEFRACLEGLSPGTSFTMEWVQLWRAPTQYRCDSSVWSNSWKHFGFIDDRKMEYGATGVINDHTFRIPLEATKITRRFDYPKVLHFQFTDFNRMLAKQRLYRITELLNREGNRFINSIKINNRYAPSKDETSLRIKDLPSEWTTEYTPFLKLWKPQSEVSWFEKEAAQLISEKGVQFFKWIDIWDYDWKNRFPQYRITDPRRFIIRIYHRLIVPFCFIRNYLHKINTRIGNR